MRRPSVYVVLIFASILFSAPVWAEDDARSKERIAKAEAIVKALEIPPEADVVDYQCKGRWNTDMYCKLMDGAWSAWRRQDWASTFYFAANALQRRPKGRWALEAVGRALLNLEGCDRSLPYVRVAATYSDRGDQATADYIHCMRSGAGTIREDHRVLRLAHSLARRKQSSWWWYVLADIYRDRRDYPTMRQYMKRLREGAPEEWRTHDLLGNLHKSLAEYAEAVDSYTRAYELAEEPERRMASAIDLANANLQAGNFDKASEWLDRVDVDELSDEDRAEAEEKLNEARAGLAALRWVATGEGSVEAIAKQVAEVEVIRPHFHFFRALDAEGGMEAMPAEQVAELDFRQKFDRLVLMTRHEEAEELAREEFNDSGSSDAILALGEVLMRQGKCGYDNQSARRVIKTRLGWQEYIWKSTWQWTCNKTRKSGNVNFTWRAPRDLVRVASALYASAGLFLSWDFDEVMEPLAGLRDEDSETVHRFAMWMAAAAGDSTAFKKHRENLNRKSIITYFDQRAAVYLAARQGNIAAARELYKALPHRERPAISTIEVELLYRLIRAVHEHEPAFAMDLATRWIVTDGPREKWLFDSLKATDTTLTMRGER